MLKYALLSLCLLSVVMADDEIAATKKQSNQTRQDAKLTNNNRNGGFVAIEGFYWKAAEDGLEYASVGTGNNQNAIQAHLKQKSPHFEWDPGFRVEAGYLAGRHDKWVASAMWTHFNTDAKNSFSGLNGITSFVVPAWFPEIFDVVSKNEDAYVSGQSKSSLHFNTIDLTLGRDFFISRKLMAHPFLGLRYAIINQHNRSSYSSLHNETTKFKAKSDFNGIGMRAGTNLLWGLTRQWGILGKLSGTLLYGHFDLASNAIDKSFGLDYRVANKFNAGRVNLEGALGLQWQSNLCFWSAKKFHTSVAALYEMSEWFSQNEFMGLIANSSEDSISNVSRQGDLFLQGFTLRVAFEF